MLVAICGVSGAGKNVIINELKEKWDIVYMPTAATREMRPNEYEGYPNIFISKRKFFRLMKKNQFLETCEVHKGTMYGTLKKVFEQYLKLNKILIKDIDYNGIESLKKQNIDIVSIFVDVKSKEVLKERLLKRGNTPEDIEKRLSRWGSEVEYKKKSDYVVFNDIFEESIKNCEEIIRIEAKKRGIPFEKNNRKDMFVIYNKTAGKGNSDKIARKIAHGLAKDCDVSLFRSDSIEKLNEYLDFELQGKGDSTLVVVGGDGTLGTCVDGALQSNKKVRIALYPSGTANDFSRMLNIPLGINDFVEFAKSDNSLLTDVAKVNETYSIHAIGVGNFSNGSTTYSQKAKKGFGILGYWVKCFFSAFKMRAQKMRVIIDGRIIEDEFLFLYVVNGEKAGGFSHFAPKASICDGKFNFVGIKKCNIFHFSWVVARLLFGIHTKSKKVVSIAGSNFEIENIGQNINPKFVVSDVDGNIGPNLPLKIEVVKQKIEIISNKSFKEEQ